MDSGWTVCYDCMKYTSGRCPTHPICDFPASTVTFVPANPGEPIQSIDVPSIMQRAGSEAERGRIVAWLRALHDSAIGEWRTPTEIADRIEQGEHWQSDVVSKRVDQEKP